MWAVCLALVALFLVITWPLVAEMGSSVPGDYGDPVFVTWVMAWVNRHLGSGTFDGFWNAGIFFPERGTLAYSEHFVAQAAMVLPVSLVTGNHLLAYNAAFMLTFVLTGAGVFLLVRGLTGSAVAAAVAAIVATFNEYRLVYEVAHLHTLSIHWFPFALYALHRYFETDRRVYLAGAVVFVVLLSLSSIYYMAYCAPLIVVFTVIEGLRFGRLTQMRVWLELWAAAAATLVLLTPFLLPYLDVQRRLGVERSLDELVLFSARLDHYRAALPAMSAAVAAAMIGIVGGALTRNLRVPMLTTLCLLVLAVWLSLGPVVTISGAEWPSLYALLHNNIPGYSALRVPARFASLFFVFLGMLAAIGVASVERRWRSAGQVIAAIVAIAFLLGSAPDKLQMNEALHSEGLVVPPPPYLTPSPAMPGVYRAVETLRPTAILAELPFGDPWYDIRYMFFASSHHRRMLNGYSGIFPPSYRARQRVLSNPLLDPEAAAQALRDASHVIVHRQAWPNDFGARVSAWLEHFGARLIAEADGAALYELPVRENFAGS